MSNVLVICVCVCVCVSDPFTRFIFVKGQILNFEELQCVTLMFVLSQQFLIAEHLEFYTDNRLKI